MSRPSSSRPCSARTNTVNLFPSLKGFVFTEKLGSGTYATVYKAYKKTGGRDVVAIKCVLKSSLNKASTENLLREIELLKKLKHENIVELYDFQWDEKYIFLIMEFCSGGDLSRFIRSKRTLPERVVKKFLKQLVSAMLYLREHNVAHMDLKPQNVLLTSASNPTVKIADFGFAKHMFDGDKESVMKGSPLYMAPEIICQKTYDARVDLWSIGVILYECLFGRAPFASKSFQELGAKIWNDKPVELPYGVSVGEDCGDLITRLLQRDPDKRITYEELAKHSFIDIEHLPSSSSLQKAVSVVKDAVTEDTKGNYSNAIRLYCKSLEYFMPAIHHEKCENKKEALRKKVKEYMNRAEELKKMIRPKKDSEMRRSVSSDPMEELLDLSKDDEELQAALKVIKAAEMEESNEEYERALTHYELGLKTVITYLKEDSNSRRKKLLSKQASVWMSEAEKIKSFLDVSLLNTNDTSGQEEMEENEHLQTGTCNLQ
ncbi:serine/threonine-protein kinase ULK3-like [Mytilus californianus]|uniref:serine/threonine-protein kinase ULK3-like n=1 Tax=Mytilus californianus TaxID=6549 RepID=UPI0022479D75|nr:serine/threonine-protein kinase ULK3-like [Mytilus californianus]